MKRNGIECQLTSYDDLFETDKSREELALAKIREIPINMIDSFPDHPFKVRDDDDDMIQLVESVKNRGIITPATLLLKDDGRYEIISGHRRKRACEIAGLETLKSEIKTLSRDDAIIEMVDSNLQRSTILPSEKAFSYKMRLGAMNRQGERTDLTSTPVVSKLRTNEKLGEFVGQSREQIRRYIRLTYLIPSILEMVDERKIAFRPAIEISFLTEDEQKLLVSSMEYNDATPSLSQAIKLKEYSKNNTLNQAVIDLIIGEEKPNQRVKPLFDEKISKLIPKTIPKDKESDYVVRALEHYNRFLQKNNRER